jgi:hypothetical protein
MNYGKICLSLLFMAPACSLAAPCTELKSKSFDPLTQITSAFPKSIEIKDKPRLIEFCPDNTCDAFATSDSVSLATLKDFAYLYIYFFSDFYVLQEWRGHDEAKETSERVLSKPEYRNCRKESSREAARCVLLDLSRNGKTRLLFINYDEGQRNVTRENIAKHLSGGLAHP